MDKKIKSAFSKVKEDYLELTNEINTVKKDIRLIAKTSNLSEEVQMQLQRLEKIDLESFVINMEKEFKSINTLIKTFNEKFEKNSKFMEEFQSELEKYHSEVKDLKKKFTNTQNRAENTNLEVEVLNSKFQDIQELLSEKINLEISSMRLEMIEEISKIYDELSKNNNKNTSASSKPPKIEKLKKSKQDDKKPKEEKKGEGKFKKAVKWLFVDDEDDTIDSIKDEVKNNK